MSKVLVNYNYDKKKDKYSILENEYVFADLPIAVMETEDIINDPFVTIIDNLKHVVDRNQYMQTHKMFTLALDENGNLVENPNGMKFFTDLDVNFEDLELKDGQIVINKKEKKTKKDKA